MNQKCLVIIDGSNFFFKLRELNLANLLLFNFSKFIANLVSGHKLQRATYYVGRIRQDNTLKNKKLFDGHQKLIGALKKHNVKYNFGYLLKSDGVYHEKGVDVQIAVDMIVSCYEEKIDRIILISSDTDLTPAINKVCQKGVFVEYVGFTHNPSKAMIGFCTQSRLLTKEDMAQFILQSPKVL